MEQAPSHARMFFDAFLSALDRAAFLRELVAQGHEESEWLDFKGCVDGEPKANGAQISRDKRKQIFSVAVCGFANTGGGVLVWGINCAKDARGIDCANGFARARDLPEWKALLREWSLPLADPPINGIEIEAVEDETTPGEGFIVCFVPESRIRPHRCEMNGKRYIIRVSANFVDAPVSLLRNLFLPQARPILIARFQMGPPVVPGENKLFRLELSIANKGTRTAHDIFVRFYWRPRHVRPGVWHPEHLCKLTAFDNGFTIEPHKSLHPGLIVPTVTIEPDDIPSILRQAIEATALIYARDAEPVLCRCNFDSDEIGIPARKMPAPVPI